MDKRSSHWSSIALSCLLLLALASCGGTTSAGGGNTATSSRNPIPKKVAPRSAADTVALSQRFANTLPPQAYALLGSLSKPAAHPVSGAHGTSVSLPQSINPGGEYSAASEAGWFLKSGNVSVDADSALLAPTGADSFAYIVYRYDSVGTYASQKPKSLHIETGSRSGNFGVAMYDWSYGSFGRWQPLFYGPAQAQQTINVDLAGSDFTNADNNLAFVVFCADPASMDLTSVSLSNYATNIQPYSSIVYDGSAKVSQDVTLDASASGDVDGTIVNYAFDPEGDGNWVDNGNSPSFSFAYPTMGIHQPKVKVTDSEGGSSTSQTSVLVVPQVYSEVENNDTFGEATPLPALPFSDFSANCGDTGDNDGDTIDIFTFNANPGDEVNFSMMTGAASCSMQVQLFDANNVFLTSASGFPSTVHYEFTGSETGPFYLEVQTFFGSSDYLLSGDTHIVYDEFENNDAVANANGLSNFDSTHQLIQFDGSLGSGGSYTGNDGDSDDWYSFASGMAGVTVNLDLDYESATGNLGFSLFDSEGDLLANAATGGGHEAISYVLQPGDKAPFYIHAAAGSGFSDYELSGSLVFDGSNYDEVEPNDDSGEANALPAFPFNNLRGNIGYDGQYDDDGNDYYTFTAQPGDKFDFTVNLSNPASMATVEIWDAGRMADMGTAQKTGTTIHDLVTVSQDAVGPFVVVVYDFQGEASDYTIDAVPVP